MLNLIFLVLFCRQFRWILGFAVVTLVMASTTVYLGEFFWAAGLAMIINACWRMLRCPAERE
jgi:uncharacterized membrane protein